MAISILLGIPLGVLSAFKQYTLFDYAMTTSVVAIAHLESDPDEQRATCRPAPLAGAEFDSERNHYHLRHVHAAQSVIPAKRGKRTWLLKGVRVEIRTRTMRTP